MMAYGTWPTFKPPEPSPAANPDCFLCGEPASRRDSTLMFCDRHPEGEVRWCAYRWSVQELRDTIHWYGKMIPAVDFTQPDALGSPA